MPLDLTQRYLLRRLAEQVTDEEERVEFTQLDPLSAESWSGVIKEVIAMANTSGGVIVFDCDSHGQPLAGPPGPVDQVDTATISQKIDSYTRENVDVVKWEATRNAERRAAWYIPESDFPIVFTRDADVDHRGVRNPAFREGQVYVRRISESRPARTGDLRRSVERRAQRIVERVQALANSAASPVATVAATPQEATSTPQSSVPNRTLQ